LAAGLMKEKKSQAEIISTAFERIICRKPTDAELKQLNTIYDGQLNFYQQNPAEASKFLASGEYPIPSDINKVTLAANAEVVQTLYNLDETIVKN
jgi:hypothetical protein